MSKKFISLVLALMLAVSMVAVAAVSVSAETDDTAQVSADGTNTYYFYLPSNSSWVNSESKGNVGYYYWGVNGAPDWPGTVATATGDTNVFSVDLPSNVVNLIWNNTVDGGDDMTLPIHGKAAQTVNLGLDGYYDGDSDYYGEMDSFDGMIYILNSEADSVDDGGKSVWGGEWFYYYGNGEYGTAKTKDALTDDDYYGKDGAFPTKIGVEETSTSDEATAASMLRVNSTSNYFGAKSVDYNADTKQISITYKFSADKGVLSTDWTLTYDSSVLELATEDGNAVNTVETISPIIAAGSGASVELGVASENGGTYKCVNFSASNLSLYDFSEDSSVYAYLVFDVLSDEATETTLDMTVNSLVVSELGEDGTSDSSKEVALVSNKVVADDTSNVTTKTDTEIDVETSDEKTTDSEELPLVLTVTAESNYFSPAVTEKYNETTKQITVTYYFSSSKNILNTQWYLKYDPNVLTLAQAEDEEDQDVCPTMTAAGGTQVNLNDKADGYGYVRFIASDLKLYDYNDSTVFATATFDVNDISGIAPVETVISLQVESLVVSDVDSDGLSNADDEVVLVKNYKVMSDESAAAVKVDNSKIVLTESSYVPTSDVSEETTETQQDTDTTDFSEATTVVPTVSDVSTTATETVTDVSTTATETVSDVSTTATETVTETQQNLTTATTSPATPDEPAETVASSSAVSSSTDDTAGGTTTTGGAAVQTGTASLSLVILALLVGATCVMFVLRKKENLL